ncbi:Ig-like domain-containing protein [Rhodoferax sp.]|uniref:Ig-like domain-containing protein n=1 Tax=Rhodoferax sp. TaxID=50421 RepID=UPI00374D7ACF
MKKYEGYARVLPWFMALVLSVLLAACGGGEPILGAPGVAGAVPVVTEVVPGKNATLVPVNTKIITTTFSKAMDPATLTPASFTLTCPGAAGLTGVVTYAAASNTATLALPAAAANLPFATRCTVAVSTAATDATGIALGAAFASDFTTAPAIIVVPTVTSATPAANAVVAVNLKTVTATFSQVMDATTITPASFTLACSPANTPNGLKTSVAGTAVAYPVGGVVATLTVPAADLPASAACTATVTTAAKDAIGTAMAANFTRDFTTGVAPDTTRPLVASTVPATSSPIPTNVPTNTAITATFSEDMAPATIIPANFTLTCALPCVSPTNPSVSYSSNAKQAILTPLNPLAAGTTYTATVTRFATDVAGNQLAGKPALPTVANDYVWTFTTLPAPALDIIAPWVTLTTPADQALNVPVTQAINATFSEPMLATTMITNNFKVAETLVPANTLSGNVAYDAANKIATFLPNAPGLKAGTQYTVTVTNGATDLAGNPLVVPAVGGLPVPNPWTFTTAAAPIVVVPPPPLYINLRSAASFGIASRAGLTTTGVTVVNGDIAINPTPTCSDATGNAGASQTCLVKTYASPTGMTVNGSIYWAGDPFDNGGTATSVTNDLVTAWNQARAKVPTMPTVAGDQLSSLIPYLPGVYHNATLGLAAGGTATFDALGDVNAIWLFQVDSSFVDSGTLLLPSQIILKNGAQARNVWFVTGLDVTIGSGTSWNGNILAGRTAVINNGSTVIGRVLAGATGAGAITLTGAGSPSKTTITVPAN